MTQSAPAPCERRSHARTALPRRTGRIALLYRSADTADRKAPGTAADALNLSPGGAYVRCNCPEAVGTSLLVMLRIPLCEEPIEARARVCWRVSAEEHPEGAGMGIEFLALDALSSRRLHEYCASWESLEPAA